MRRTAILISLILIGGLGNQAVASDLYRNETLGISVRKPATWVYLTDAQNRENISRMKMSDAEFQAYVVRNARVPIFAITKYPEPYGDLNPSVKIVARPATGMNARNLPAVLKGVIDSIASRVGKVEAIEGPKSIQLAGLPAAYGAIDYVLTTQDGAQFPTKSQMWWILKGNVVFMIGAGTRLDEKTGSRREIQQVIDSIRFN